MKYLKKIFKNRVLNSYESLSLDYLRELKIIQKNMLDLKIVEDKNIDLTLKGLLYNFIILPYFSKFFIFFNSFNLPIIIPLPKKHLLFLKKNGIKCNVPLSLILFYFFIFYTSTKKSILALKHILFIKKNFLKENTVNIYFPKVTDQSQIPNNQCIEQNYTFIESCVRALNLKPNKVYHFNDNLKKFSINKIDYEYGYPINGLSLDKKIFLILISFFNFIYFSFLIFFKWHKLYLLDQIIYKNFFMFSSSSDYIKQENHIIYDLQDQLLRPYWTYFANKDIFKFHLINSASGFYGFKYKGAYPTDTMFHHLCNWNNYYVDSLIFFEHLKNIIPSCILLDEKISRFHISEKIPIVKNNKIKISIFDVVPHHLYSRALMLPEDRYRVSSTCIQFLTDILKCLENEDVIIYLKTKHYLNSDRYPDDYVTFIEKINNNNIVKINPRYSPKLISLNSHFSISSPFTTAAFYKTIYNYNFFYDPSNIIYKDDRARQNLKLISGYSELENYLDDIIKDIKLTMNKDNKLIV